MKTLARGIDVGSFAALAVAGPASVAAQADLDCWQFGSWQEA